MSAPTVWFNYLKIAVSPDFTLLQYIMSCICTYIALKSCFKVINFTFNRHTKIVLFQRTLAMSQGLTVPGGQKRSRKIRRYLVLFMFKNITVASQVKRFVHFTVYNRSPAEPLRRRMRSPNKIIRYLSLVLPFYG